MEEWKIINGYSNYEISSCGRIRNIKGNIRKQQTHYKGYKIISLRGDNGKRKTLKVHRLVAEAFIKNNENYDQVNHIDTNKTNNNVENLEWCNNSQNQKHAFQNKLKNNHGINNPNCKLTTDQVKEILKNKNETSIYFAKKYNVSRSTISKIRTHKNWRFINI